MAKKSTYAKFQSDEGKKFFPLYADFLDSKSFTSLSPNAVAIYIYLYRKYRCKVECGIITKTNYDNISFTKDEIKEKRKQGYGLPAYNASMAAIDELIEKGILICKTSGYTTRTCNIYAFHHGWKTKGYIPEERHKRLARRSY